VSSETTNVAVGVTGLSGRYATALFDLADGASALEQVADDLRQLATMIEESDDLARLLRSPVISRADQSAAMLALLEKSESSELTRNFIGVVASNRRLFALSDIIKDYLMVLAGRRGEMTAEVTSAKALTDSQQAEIVAALQSSVGGKVFLNSSVDPALLGGLVVKIGSRMVDSSLQTKLQHLKLAMRGVG
jgi:F-type H+-transporting ATPase subunit delta